MPERLRFDFTHPEPLSSDELRAVEAEVNERILAGIATEIRELPIEEAKELGAIALFGEKYGNIVRVVEVPEVSIELCGGSHVRNTGEIGSFRILSESGIGSGIRRIEAVTGHAAYRLAKQDMNDLAQAAELLKARPQELLEKLEKLLAEKKELAQELSSLHQAQAKDQVGDLVKNAVTQDGLRIAKGIVEVADVQELRALGDMLKGRDDIQALLLGARIGEKVNLVAMADATAVARGIHAGNAVKAAAKVAGGGGGGRPDMAQAGGKDPAKLGEAIEAGVAVMLQALA